MNAVVWIASGLLAAMFLLSGRAGAIITHARRSEYSTVAMNAVLLALALFVALQRL